MNREAPGITVDSNHLKNATKILDWMCMNGNMVAESRRSELAELTCAVATINDSTRLEPMSLDQQVSSDANRLWMSLDLGEVTGSNVALSTDLSMDLNMSTLDSMEDDQWLWAVPGLEASDNN